MLARKIMIKFLIDNLKTIFSILVYSILIILIRVLHIANSIVLRILADTNLSRIVKLIYKLNKEC